MGFEMEDQMKQIFCASMVALLLLWAWPTLAELDFSDMTLEELYEARDALDRRIDELEGQQGVRSYEIGVDMPAGDYVLIEKGNAMFASLAIQSPGASAAQHMSKLVSGQAVVRLEKGSKITISGLTAWPLGSEPDRNGEDGTIGEGGYLVGVQLPAGDYVAQPQDLAPLSSYSVYTGILGTDAQLTQFQLLHEATPLTLKDGDYVELSGCSIIPEEQ